ncbi:MAG TPA: GNAT family N-acetyltransferase [Pyrinomonadaceae bacterium]|nr:GNAT family N-acetyltransferase [Pyrinomonadaceae bacterium]
MLLNVEIVEFRNDLAGDFAALNYEWIEKYFTVEQHDREILDDPQKWVIDPGGMIFFAVANGRAVGTVAMIPAGDNTLELTKMAVAPDARGLGVGDLLMAASVDYAKDSGAKTVWLESHTKLSPAISLYRKHGFVEVPGDPNSLYARADIRMELAIQHSNM